MEKIVIKASPKQVARLRNGHKVRVSKPDVEGEGVNLIVRPETYHQVSRTFSRGKGTTLQLNPDELMASSKVEGKGLFSDLKKALPIKEAVSAVADVVKDAGLKGKVERLADKNLKGSARKLAQKGIEKGAEVASKVEKKMKGGSFLKSISKVAKSVVKNPIAQQVAKTGINLASAEAKRQGYDPMLVGIAGDIAKQGVASAGQGLYAGRGLYAGVHSARGGAVGYLGGRNQLLKEGHLPPAMRSDAIGANFMMNTQLPPSMQRW